MGADLDQDKQRKFLEHLTQGDGYKVKPGKWFSYATVSRDLYEGIKRLLIKLGYYPNLIPHKTQTSKTGTYFKVDYRINPQAPWAYYDEKYFCTPIKEISEEDYSGKVYNLEVQDDESYVSPSATLHNCHPPFFHPNWKGMDPGKIAKSPDTPDPPTRRKMAIEWIDREIISRILKLDYEELVVTADHPLSHPGDERGFIQELESSRSPQEYQVFLATDVRK